MKTLSVFLVLVCLLGLVQSWEWPWNRQPTRYPIPSPNPRDKWCRLNLGPAWGGRC
ncbi:accessory gland-specific peptide 70A [Drosophila sechellia]|uniref:Sex peptide n=1 Tax=Drosophila sechellia TaxID=7238 RepID=A70A_DROSE|nr:accessory gland-specific peptide 70A [Drosophila sechellia]O18417.1 RecName: Full=Accessory gland-specific peptide 70A; AltName: Full=Paragonial peptide B; AltName: Full=Sex peptide; Short=SP; Flags: Precursor [Drosophila sechellia]EDW41367.1 accessory gland peptide 70A [Drosophila sechellia]CAA67791.1 sex-peptide [Drosophila sechellia]